MTTFAGAYEITLGTKKRISIPHIFLEAIAYNNPKVLYSVVSGHCLEFFPEDNYLKFLAEKGIAQLDVSNPERQRFFGLVKMLTWDKQGRVVLDESQLKTAGINSPCLIEILGNIDRISIAKAK